MLFVYIRSSLRPAHTDIFLLSFSVEFTSAFRMADQGKRRKKHKRRNLTISAKLELLKKFESGYSVAKVCEEYGVKKQTVSDICKAKEKLQALEIKFDVDANTDKSGMIHKRKRMKMCTSKELEEVVFKWYTQERSVKCYF